MTDDDGERKLRPQFGTYNHKCSHNLPRDDVCLHKWFLWILNDKDTERGVIVVAVKLIESRAGEEWCMWCRIEMESE